MSLDQWSYHIIINLFIPKWKKAQQTGDDYFLYLIYLVLSINKENKKTSPEIESKNKLVLIVEDEKAIQKAIL